MFYTVKKINTNVHRKKINTYAEKIGAPVITTFKAKGQIPDSHPLAAGVLGRSGTPIASWFMNESDLMLVLGASYSNHTGISPKRATIQVDHDPMALGRFFPAGQKQNQSKVAVETAKQVIREFPESQRLDEARRNVKKRMAVW